ncbi:MAG: hypothetical protein H0X13_16405 [Ramlibacter sp.]|nr:hypothetical protein [Ramlibacter sp.]
MSKRKDGQARGKYTLEFKLEAVRLVKGGQAVPVTAKILGVPVQTPRNRCEVRLDCKAQVPLAGHTDLRGVGGQHQWLLRALATQGHKQAQPAGNEQAHQR